MPIHRGSRLDGLISRLPYKPIALQANIYQTWPNLSNGVSIAAANTWYEMISAASAPTVPFTVVYSGHGAWTGDGGLNPYIELGIGASGSEVAIAAAPCRAGAGFRYFRPYPVIPGGTRVAIRSSVGQGGGALISALLPPRYPNEDTLRYVPKENWGRYYAGIPSVMNWGYPGVAANNSQVAWTYGTWTEILASTAVTDNAIITTLLAAPFQNGFNDNQIQIGFGYGGTDGAGNAPTASFADIATGFAERTVNNYGPFVFELPVPIFWPSSTRFTARMAFGVSTAGAGGPYVGGMGAIKVASLGIGHP